MTKVTATQILDLARSQLGTKATNTKRCKYNKWFYGTDVSGSGFDWCNVFLQWLFAKLDASEMLYTKTANVGYQAIAFKEKGRLITKKYKAGDLVIFSWSGEKSTWINGVKTLDHIGIIETVNADGTYTTIEGNTGATSNGEVKRQIRRASQISCCLRPDYRLEKSVKFSTYNIRMQKLWSNAKTNDKNQVKTLQYLLRTKGYKGADKKTLVVDGEFGNNTEFALKSFQKENDLKQSGICYRAEWSKLLFEYKK